MARLGASSTAASGGRDGHRARARPSTRRSSSHAVADLRPATTVRVAEAPSAAVRSCGPEDLATTTRLERIAAPAPAVRATVGIAGTVSRAAALPSAGHGRVEPVVRPRAHGAPGGGESLRLRTVRRSRVPWPDLPRERLAAAWGRIQTEHAAAGELLLVGVYGPVPIDAISSVALDPDGRLAMTFARRGVRGRWGDVALARQAVVGPSRPQRRRTPRDRVILPLAALISRV